MACVGIVKNKLLKEQLNKQKIHDQDDNDINNRVVEEEGSDDDQIESEDDELNDDSNSGSSSSSLEDELIVSEYEEIEEPVDPILDADGNVIEQPPPKIIRRKKQREPYSLQELKTVYTRPVLKLKRATGINGLSLKDFQIVSVLGQGGFGQVFLVKQHKHNQLLALKKILISLNGQPMTEQRRLRVMREAMIMESIQHDNVVKLHSHFIDCESEERELSEEEARRRVESGKPMKLQQQTKKKSRGLSRKKDKSSMMMISGPMKEIIERWYLCIVMEHASKGDLLQLIEKHKQTKESFDEAFIWTLCSQIGSGLQFLHTSQQVVHRDIKPQNILMTSNGLFKIGDLGISRKMLSKSLNESKIGTPLYASPELIKKQPYDYKIDMWALGCVLQYMCCLEHPFMHNVERTKGQYHVSRQSMEYQILNLTPKSIPEQYSNRLRIVIQRLLEKDQQRRLSSNELISLIPKEEICADEILQITQKSPEMIKSKLLDSPKKDQFLVVKPTPQLQKFHPLKDILTKVRHVTPKGQLSDVPPPIANNINLESKGVIKLRIIQQPQVPQLSFDKIPKHPPFNGNIQEQKVDIPNKEIISVKEDQGGNKQQYMVIQEEQAKLPESTLIQKKVDYNTLQSRQQNSTSTQKYIENKRDSTTQNGFKQFYHNNNKNLLDSQESLAHFNSSNQFDKQNELMMMRTTTDFRTTNVNTTQYNKDLSDTITSQNKAMPAFQTDGFKDARVVMDFSSMNTQQNFKESYSLGITQSTMKFQKKTQSKLAEPDQVRAQSHQQMISENLTIIDQQYLNNANPETKIVLNVPSNIAGRAHTNFKTFFNQRQIQPSQFINTPQKLFTQQKDQMNGLMSQIKPTLMQMTPQRYLPITRQLQMIGGPLPPIVDYKASLPSCETYQQPYEVKRGSFSPIKPSIKHLSNSSSSMFQIPTLIPTSPAQLASQHQRSSGQLLPLEKSPLPTQFVTSDQKYFNRLSSSLQPNNTIVKKIYPSTTEVTEATSPPVVQRTLSRHQQYEQTNHSKQVETGGDHLAPPQPRAHFFSSPLPKHIVGNNIVQSRQLYMHTSQQPKKNSARFTVKDLQ